MERDPSAAATALSALSDALRRMHTTLGPLYGKLAAIARGEAPQTRPTEDVIVERAIGHLDVASARDARLTDAHDRITARVRHLRSAVTPRRAFGLVQGELGPDHVLVTPAGEPVMIDFEGWRTSTSNGTTPGCTCASAMRTPLYARSNSTTTMTHLNYTGTARRYPSSRARYASRTPTSRIANGCWIWPNGTLPRRSPKSESSHPARAWHTPPGKHRLPDHGCSRAP